MPHAPSIQPGALAIAQPLRLGVAGGALGRTRYGGALLAARPRVQVAAIVDADTRSARAWARELGAGGAEAVFADLEALLASPLAFDALLIASPLPDRAPHIKQAALAGKPILCEIPFAATLGETDDALRTVQDAGVLLLPALWRRFDARFQQASDFVASGAVGTLRQARCHWTYPYAGAAAAEIGEENWNALLSLLACQTADACRWWLGGAQTVSADVDVQAEDALAPTGKNRQQWEAIANLIVTHARGQSTHHLARTRAGQPDERYVLTGSTGRLELIAAAPSGSTLPSLTLYRPGQRPEPLDGENAASPEPIRALLQHFAHCVQTGQTPAVTGADLRAAMEIVQAAYLSSQENLKVSLPLRVPAIAAPLPRALPFTPPA